MRLSHQLGIPTANVATTEVAGRKIIVVERYDRIVAADGAVERIHQEDFCQATATRPENKYEEDGGPSLRTVAGIVDAVATRGSLEMLLAGVTLHALVGNGDAHAKNISLLHDRSGILRLAPLYDAMSTLFYGDDRLAMYVDSVRRTDRLTVARIVNEGTAWGLPRARCDAIVTDLLARAPQAIEAARDDTDGLPDAVISAVNGQVKRLRGE
jgi:serine/threonine-protein kinase HipA